MNWKTNILNRKHIYATAVIVILTTLVFAQTITFDFVDYDDPTLVVHNTDISTPSLENAGRLFFKLIEGTYTPIRYLSHMLDHALYATNPAGHHLSNVILHTSNGLCFYVLGIVIGLTATQSLLASLIFSLHPLNSETVSWVSARKELLFVFFLLLSVIAYIRYQKTDRRRLLILSLFAYLLSCLSKVTATFFFPLFFFLPQRPLATRLKTALPFSIIGIALAGASLGLYRYVGHGVAAPQPDVLERLMTAQRALNAHLLSLIFPIHLSPFAAIAPNPSVEFAPFAVSVLLVLSAILLYLRKKTFALLLGLILIPMIPVVLFSTTSENISARYLYSAVAPLALCLTLALSATKRRFQIGVATALIVTFIFVTVSETRKWKNSETLWTTALLEDPESYRAAVGVVKHELGQGRLREAFELMTWYLPYDPYYPTGLRISALVLKSIGLIKEAEIQHALAMKAIKPHYRHRKAVQEVFERYRHPQPLYSRLSAATWAQYQQYQESKNRLGSFLAIRKLMDQNSKNIELRLEFIKLCLEFGLPGVAKEEWKTIKNNVETNRPTAQFVENVIRFYDEPRQQAGVLKNLTSRFPNDPFIERLYHFAGLRPPK